MTGDPYAPWWSHNIVIFDVETTGLDDDDRVVEVGLVRFEEGRVVDQWGSLIYPEREIPDEAANIHGITTVDVATAPPFVGSLPAITRIARDAWPAAYNASFDKRMWAAELSRLPIDSPNIPMFDPQVRWIDPLVWVRQIDGLWAKNKLTVACERWGVPLHNAHRATDDAIASGKLLFGPLRRRLRDWTITELLRKQQLYANDHEVKRRDWFRKKGIPYR